jgi:hypothetical protein
MMSMVEIAVDRVLLRQILGLRGWAIFGWSSWRNIANRFRTARSRETAVSNSFSDNPGARSSGGADLRIGDVARYRRDVRVRGRHDALRIVMRGADKEDKAAAWNQTLTAAQPNPFEAPDYLARARTFRQAALQLTDMLGHQPNWPKYFLLGHAIELALKAVPKYCQRSRSYQKPSGDEPANHDLVGQYTWAKLHGLPANDIAEEMMPHLSELHLEHFARYPQPLKSVIMISEFDDLVDAILSDVAKFVRAG